MATLSASAFSHPHPVCGAIYSKVELIHLSNIMSRMIPIGNDEWKNVLTEHTKQYEDYTLYYLRMKYTSKHHNKFPTGSPNIPQEVLLKKGEQFDYDYAKASKGKG